MLLWIQNIVFSSLIPSNSIIRDNLLNNFNVFFSPNYLIYEIYNHKEKLIKLSKFPETQFYIYFNSIIERIRFIPLNMISLINRQKSYDICRDTDLKDIPFVALSLELNLPLWTGDKKLISGLIEKGFNNFFVIK
jgi:predicted nucleic acid-binding protein